MKRQHSASTDIKQNRSRRARLLSNIWESQQEGISEGTPSQSNSPVYKINGIIGERSDSYLIDWANHPTTGESFKPDWQPKKNANFPAVQAWENRKSLKREKTNGKRRKQRRLRRQAKLRRASTASVSTVSTDTARNLNVQSNNNQSFCETFRQGNILQAATEESDAVAVQSPSLDTSNLPDLTVQISQHSSLDKDLYVAYYSSLSTQGNLHSTVPQAESGLCESSPLIETSPSRANQTDGIVPDSQSLPGSSSYAPTSSLTSCSTSLSTNVPERSGIVIPPSQSSISHSQRSRSAPASSSTELLLSLGRGTPPSLYRSASYPTSVIQVPGSSEPCSIASKPSEKESPCQASIFQTQVPLEDTFESLNLPLTSADHWQGGQAISHQVQSSLQSLSESISEDSRKPRSAGGVVPRTVSTTSHVAFRQSTLPETFEVSEDRTGSSHPSQATTTDDSILSLRDPNSQSSRLGSLQQKKENSRHSYDSQSIEQGLEEQFPPCLIPIDLPTSLDIREPPQPPFDSMAGSSDHSDGSGPQRLPSIAEALRIRMQQITAGSEAQLASQRAERQTQDPTAAYSPSLGQTHIEIPAGFPSSAQSPKRTMPPKVVTPQASFFSPTVGLRVPSPETVRSQRSTESPMIIPEKAPYQYQDEPSRLEVEPSEILKDMPLPVRASQSVSHSPVAARRLTQQTESAEQMDILDVRRLGDQEFIVPLSMPPRTQAQYIDTYRYYGKRIKRFLENRNSGRELVAELNTLLDRIGKVTTHMDLDGGGPSSQEQFDMEDEASYAVSCSEKFKFLGCLLDFTRDDDLHIAIVARPGQLMDFIEIFLKAKKVSYNRADTMTRSDKSITGGSLQVSIIASGDEGASSLPQVAGLVIAFDETFNLQDPQVKTLRTHVINVGELSPVIRLVVYGALEHIDLCLPTTLEPVDRLRKLICFMVQTELSVGQLEPGEPLAATCAERVAEFLRSHGSAEWGLPAIRPLIDVSMMDSDATVSDADAMSDFSEGRKSHEPIRYWPNSIVRSNNIQTGGKRSLDLEYGDSLKTQAKKQKLASKAGSSRTDQSPSKTPESLQNHLDKATEYILTLTSEIASTKARLEDYASWLEARQRQFEDDRATISTLTGSNNDLTTALTKTMANLATASQTILDLKATNQTLSSEIASLHAQLLASPNPEISCQESLRSQVATLEATNAGQSKKITSLTRDFEFTRLQYQTASNAAVDATAELDTLKSQQPALERRADAQLSHLRETRDRDENAGLRKEVARLRDTVKQRDSMLRSKEGEIVELKRGRQGVQTRGSSVQPGVRSPKGGRSPRGGSRAGSPAVGMLGPGKALSGLGARFGA